MPALASPVRIVSLLAVLLAALTLTACGDSDSGSVERVKIAALVSLSGPGAPIGTEQARAMRLAVSRLNTAGGIDGTKLQLLVVDSRSDPDHSAQEMRRLIVDEQVAAVLGPTRSLEAVKADPVADSLKTPVLAVSNTVPGIVGDCPYSCDWIWRNSLGAQQTVTANVAFAVAQGSPATAALLSTEPDVLAEAETRIASAAFRARGVRIVGDVAISPPLPGASSTQLRRDVAQALAARPQALFVSSSDSALAAQAIQVARAQGFRGQLLGGDVLNESGTRGAADEAGPGVRSGAAWFAGNDFPANVSFVRAYEAAFRAAPDQFAAQAYAGIGILAQAIERGGARDADLSIAQRRAAIQRGLHKVALTTPLGPFRFTPEHDVNQIVWILQTQADGGHDLVQFCDPGC